MAETLVCAVADVSENAAKRFDYGPNGLAVFNVAGAFYATDDECTHAAASLAEGIIEGEVIECPLHFGAFNVKTGEAVQAPCFTALRTYKVEVRDGNVYVDFDKEAGQ